MSSIIFQAWIPHRRLNYLELCPSKRRWGIKHNTISNKISMIWVYITIGWVVYQIAKSITILLWNLWTCWHPNSIKITSQTGIRLASYATRNFLVSHSCWIMEPCSCKNLGRWKRQHLVKVIMHSVTLSTLWKQSRLCKCLTLKWHRVLIYVHLHNLCGLHKVHKSYHVCLCVWNLIIDIVLCNHPNIYVRHVHMCHVHKPSWKINKRYPRNCVEVTKDHQGPQVKWNLF